MYSICTYLLNPATAPKSQRSNQQDLRQSDPEMRSGWLASGWESLAMPPGLAKQPAGQGQLIIVQPGRTLAVGVARLHYTAGQILADRVTTESGSSGYLPNRHPVPEMPPSDYT